MEIYVICIYVVNLEDLLISCYNQEISISKQLVYPGDGGSGSNNEVILFGCFPVKSSQIH